MRNINFLSVVIPAYRQEKTIINDINSIYNVLSSLSYKFEIIVVVDGYLDNTLKNVRRINKDNVKAFGYEKNQGKGYAVKYGMLKAKGDVIGFIDAGMDVHPAGISILLDSMVWRNADIIIGSKLHPESKRINYPFFRQVLSWGYRNLTHILFGFSVKDTQVGLKFFKRDVVEKVFPKLLVKTLAFDVEILALANSFGFKKIYEGPVELNFNGGNSITSGNFWKIIILMLWDTMTVYYRLKILKLYKIR